jgi:hypothetical protein
MALQDEQVKEISLQGEGIAENVQIVKTGELFRSNGVFCQSDSLIRMNGKKRFQSRGEPVLAIHFQGRDAIWVQTKTELVQLEKLTSEWP